MGGGALDFDCKTTEAIGNVRRRDGRRFHVIDLLFVPKLHREPSLDTPNTRPFSASSQGPKLAHRKPLTSPLSPHWKKSIRFVIRASSR